MVVGYSGVVVAAATFQAERELRRGSHSFVRVCVCVGQRGGRWMASRRIRIRSRIRSFCAAAAAVTSTTSTSRPPHP